MSEELNVVGYLHKNSVGVRILSREATIMARDEGEGWSSTPLVPAAELTTLRAQNAALQAVASAASIAAEELEYFVDFAVRQCEFEGDEVAGYAAVNAVRNALAQVAK